MQSEVRSERSESVRVISSQRSGAGNQRWAINGRAISGRSAISSKREKPKPARPGSPHSKQKTPLPTLPSTRFPPNPTRKYRAAISLSHFGKRASEPPHPTFPRPGSPHSKQRTPSPSDFQLNSQSASLKSTRPPEIPDHFGKKPPAPALFSPQPIPVKLPPLIQSNFHCLHTTYKPKSLAG
jgi:hypothetical protein